MTKKNYHRQFYVDEKIINKVNEILKKYGMNCNQLVRMFISASVYQNRLIIAPYSYGRPPKGSVCLSYTTTNKDEIRKFKKLCAGEGVRMADAVKTLLSKVYKEENLDFFLNMSRNQVSK